MSYSKERDWWIDFVSGLMGGLVSVTSCAPLDIARTRLNMMYSVKKYAGFLDALKTIKREEGIKGYFKGYNATVVSIPLFHSLFFAIYNKMKPYIKEHLGDYPLVFQHMCASTFTGLVCDTLTNPLWVVRTRLQVQHMHGDPHKYNNQGLFATIAKIKREEGFKALYKGLGASLIGIIVNKFGGLSHVAVYFPIYEAIKAKFESQKVNPGEKCSSHEVLMASLISKLIACSLTYPHIVIRTRFQDNRQDYAQITRESRLKIKDVVREICHKEGFAGLYTGLKVDLVRVLPANAITFVVYEYCALMLENGLSQRIRAKQQLH